MDEFVVFKNFNTIEQAEEFADELKQHGIEYKIVDNTASLDSTFAINSGLNSVVELLIKHSEFDKVNELLESDAASLLTDEDENHYIHDFTTEELYDILKKPDEWNPFDYQLAQNILKQKGEVLNDAILKKFKEERIKELSRPEKSQLSLILSGYIFAFLGGLIGIGIGWYLFSTKKDLPNGDRINSFSESDIKHGRSMFKIGLIALIVWIVVIIGYVYFIKDYFCI